MPKNVIVCLDGTNNKFGTNNTNVVRLFQVLNRDPQQQLVYYDPGVGTMPEPGAVSRTARWVSQMMGLAFGRGLTRNIEEAYTFLMDWYEPGDRIFLFGFSRGAYTARALAGVLYQFGLLPGGMDNLVSYVLRLAKEINDLEDDNPEASRQYWQLIGEFRRTFARMDPVNAREPHRVKVHFLGLWDTVSSVGWVWDPKRFAYVSRNPGVTTVRHAISIDERRWFFRQNLWRKSKGSEQDVVELWFPGDHCDVGGGHDKGDNDLSYESLLWMLREARAANLLLDEPAWQELEAAQLTSAWWAQRSHDRLRGAWRFAQYFPKFTQRRRWPRWGMKLQWRWPWLVPAGRSIPHGVLLHRSALLRIRDKGLGYQPTNLSETFLNEVRSREDVPETLRYEQRAAGMPDSERHTRSAMSIQTP